jgi:hypothetical protein
MLIIVPETNPQITMTTKTYEAYCPNKINMDFLHRKKTSKTSQKLNTFYSKTVVPTSGYVVCICTVCGAFLEQISMNAKDSGP